MSREALLCQGVRKGKVFENMVLMVVLRKECAGLRRSDEPRDPGRVRFPPLQGSKLAQRVA